MADCKNPVVAYRRLWYHCDIAETSRVRAGGISMGRHAGKFKPVTGGKRSAPAQHRPAGVPPVPATPAIGRTLSLALGCGLVAAYLMFANLSYGLPLVYHPDEARKLQLLTDLAQGHFPRFFAHPHFMLNFSAPFMLAAKGLGLYPHLGARAAVAFMGVATVVLLFFVGRSVGGQIAGVGAALFFATAPLAVIAAHDFKEDIPLAFWLTIQLLFLVRYLKGARPRDLYLAAAALGGAVGTKYTGVAAALLLAGCVLFGPERERRWQRLGNAILLAGVVFLVCTPAILIDPVAFMADASFEARHAIIGHSPEMVWDRTGRLETGKPLKLSPLASLWTYHLRHSLVPGISIAGLLLTVYGVLIALSKGGWAGRLIASGLILFYFLLESLPLKPPPFAARYMVAVLPYAALLVGQAVAAAWKGSVAQRLVVGVLFAATLGLNSFHANQQVQAMRPETRDLARAWVFDRIPQGSRLIVPGLLSYSPLAYPSRPTGFPYHVVVSAARSSEILEMGLDPQAYIIVSSFDYQRYLDHTEFDPEATRFYRRLFEWDSPVATFKVPFRPLGFHNPTIQIFHLADSPPSSAG